MLALRKRHRQIIKAHVTLEGYTVSDQSRFTFTLDPYLLKYTNATSRPDNIKLELNYSNRVQIFEPTNYQIVSTLVDKMEVLGLNKVELYGSKIAALIGRTAARDVYDVFNMIQANMITKEESINLKKCSIFYLMISNEFQTLEELIGNFNLNISKMAFSTIQRNLIPMLHVGTQIDIDLTKNTVQNYIDNLFELSKEEEKFIHLFISGKYQPEYLFEKGIVSRIEHHPMALWKIMNYKK